MEITRVALFTSSFTILFYNKKNRKDWNSVVAFYYFKPRGIKNSHGFKFTIITGKFLVFTFF